MPKEMEMLNDQQVEEVSGGVIVDDGGRSEVLACPAEWHRDFPGPGKREGH